MGRADGNRGTRFAGAAISGGRTMSPASGNRSLSGFIEGLIEGFIGGAGERLAPAEAYEIGAADRSARSGQVDLFADPAVEGPHVAAAQVRRGRRVEPGAAEGGD
jgi:hypothetical protein